MAERAYPDWQPGARDLLALDRYLGELYPEQLSFNVRQRRPKTINEAVSATVEVEILLQTILQSTQKPVSPCEHDASSQNEHDHTANPSEEKMMETLQKLNDRLVKLEADLNKPGGRQTDATVIQPATSERAREYILTNQAHNPNQPNETRHITMNPNDHNDCGHTTISINSVGSYYLSGCVSNITVAFLVDTGAGGLPYVPNHLG